MPKKWVRDARRKAREDAYRAVSAETHAARREALRAEKAPLPVYRAGPIRWRDAATLPGFLRSVLVWVDEARAFLLYDEFDPKSVPAPDSIAAVSALRLAISDWLVRATRVKLCVKHQDAFFINGEFRSRLNFVVTTRITYVGNTSIDTEHEIRIADPKSARQYGDLVAIVSGTLIPIDAKTQTPVPISAATKEFIVEKVMVPGDIPREIGFGQVVGPSSSSGAHNITVRKSDCDAFGHLNNCTAIDLFTDAMPNVLLDETVYFSIEYPTSLKAGDRCIIDWTKWTERMEDKDHWFFKADLKNGSGNDSRGLKVLFTSFWPQEDKAEGTDIDHTLPQPFSAQDETEELGEVQSGTFASRF